MEAGSAEKNLAIDPSLTAWDAGKARDDDDAKEGVQIPRREKYAILCGGQFWVLRISTKRC